MLISPFGFVSVFKDGDEDNAVWKVDTQIAPFKNNSALADSNFLSAANVRIVYGNNQNGFVVGWSQVAGHPDLYFELILLESGSIVFKYGTVPDDVDHSVIFTGLAAKLNRGINNKRYLMWK